MPYRFDSRAGDARTRVHELLDAWSTSDGLRMLVEAEGGTLPVDAPLLKRLDGLYAFSERWDFRRGGERLDITDDEIGIDLATLEAAANDLGLASATAPSDDCYDHAIVLGGTVLADYCRTKYLHDLLDGGVEAGRLGALGALRAIPGNELQAALARPDVVGDALPLLATEFDALVAAATRFFAPATDIEQSVHTDETSEHLNSAAATYTDSVGREVEILAAASSDPTRRATTIDNYSSYAKRVRDGESLLVCTSAIYLPYHFFTALRGLALGKPILVELVGFPPEWMQGVLTGPRNYLQETRTALFGAVTLAHELLA